MSNHERRSIDAIEGAGGVGGAGKGWANYDSELAKLTEQRKQEAEALSANAVGGSKGLSTTAVTGNEGTLNQGNEDGASSRNNGGDAMIFSKNNGTEPDTPVVNQSPSDINPDEIRARQAKRAAMLSQGDNVILRSLR